MTAPAPRPKSLKLEFSKAADNARVSRLFHPVTKGPADPDDYVAKRLSTAFNKAVNEGCAVFLSDENGNVQALTIAYHLSGDKHLTSTQQHDYTELGSTISLVQGYRSTVPIIAALALREWFNHPPGSEIAADIKASNVPSVKVYQDTLGWKRIDERAQVEDINDASWRTIPNEHVDPTGKTGYEGVPTKGGNMDWYACNGQTLAQQATVVLEAIKQGGITNKRTGDVIPVDFSALAKEGLTQARLEALAKGVTDRVTLKQMKP